MGGMKSCKMSKGRNASKEVANHWSAQFKNQLRNTKRLLHFSKEVQMHNNSKHQLQVNKMRHFKIKHCAMLQNFAKQFQ